MALTPEQNQVLKRIDTHLEPMPFYVKEYVLSKKRAGFSPNTLLQYLYRLTHFFEWTLREGVIQADNVASIPYSELEKMEKKTIEFYIDFLREENISTKPNEVEHRGEAVIELSIHALKALFNYLTKETETAAGECYFYRNVMSKIVLHKEKETASHRARQISSVILNEAEINEYLHFVEHEYVKTLTNDNQLRLYKRNGLRDQAINALLLGSGIRVGELAKLELKDVHLRKGYIDVIRKGNKPDSVTVMPSALEVLKRYIEERKVQYPKADETSFLFISTYHKKTDGMSVRPLSRRAIQNIVNKYTAAFLSDEKGLSPHKLRHTFAVEFMRNGGDIVLLRDQLGHNDIKTTSLYTNMANSDNLKVLKRMDERRNK